MLEGMEGNHFKVFHGHLGSINKMQPLTGGPNLQLLLFAVPFVFTVIISLILFQRLLIDE
jgi:hypothetical protein